MSEKHVRILGMIASAASISMYVSYLPQILGNLEGHKNDWFQPLVASINCVLWLSYAYLKTPRDWPLVMANIPGIILGIIASVTALL